MFRRLIFGQDWRYRVQLAEQLPRYAMVQADAAASLLEVYAPELSRVDWDKMFIAMSALNISIALTSMFTSVGNERLRRYLFFKSTDKMARKAKDWMALVDQARDFIADQRSVYESRGEDPAHHLPDIAGTFVFMQSASTIPFLPYEFKFVHTVGTLAVTEFSKYWAISKDPSARRA